MVGVGDKYSILFITFLFLHFCFKLFRYGWKHFKRTFIWVWRRRAFANLIFYIVSWWSHSVIETFNCLVPLMPDDWLKNFVPELHFKWILLACLIPIAIFLLRYYVTGW